MTDLERKKIYFKLLMIFLRKDGHLDAFAKAQKILCRRSESPVDAIVRLGMAPDPWAAAELICDTLQLDPDPRIFSHEIAFLTPAP